MKKFYAHTTDTNTQQAISDKRYIEALENSGIFAKLDSHYNFIKTNRFFCQIMHMTKEECEKTNFFSLIQENSLEIEETLKYKQTWEGLLVFKTTDKSDVHLDCSFIPILDENENVKECIFLANDITDLVISKSNIKKHLYIDSLTKLPNRLQLFTEKQLLHKEYETTCIIFNIDSFESINSLYGNNFGDKILLKTSQWLSVNLPLVDDVKLYKFEADIYMAVVFSPFSQDELETYLQNVSSKISNEKFTCSGLDLDITMTIGASQATSNQLRLAQIAYKEAKLAKKSYCIYDKKSNKEQEYTKNMKTLKYLKEVVDKDLIIPYFQPIVDLKTGKIQKYESLMRIQKEDGTIMLPHEFLHVAKNSKIYHKLSQSLIKKSFDVFKNSSIEFSINLSFLDITDKKTTDFILEQLEITGIGPWLVFELLESEGIENYKSVMKFIEQVKSYGSKIAIDDFGSGYSNFERLVELQIDYIKIDGSLIKNININEDMKIITKTIANFAKELGMKTIAEFVHSEEVLDVIKELDIDYAQGYHLGIPSKNLSL
jgi:diguanylate cyclase (GGDEF)-like protein